MHVRARAHAHTHTHTRRTQPLPAYCTGGKVENRHKDNKRCKKEQDTGSLFTYQQEMSQTQ